MWRCDSACAKTKCLEREDIDGYALIKLDKLQRDMRYKINDFYLGKKY